METRNDGFRVLNDLALMLNMTGYFVPLSVDGQEIRFWIKENPERKTAADIAKAINDNRLKSNLSRRLGVSVIEAGVRTVDSNASQTLDKYDGVGMTRLIAFILAGFGAAAVIFIICKIKGYGNSKDKLGDLQNSLSGPAETCKDYQDLCRARMTGKTGSSEGPSPGGRVVILNQENERPPSSRSSTSSWSEEPALTNMDISTGHMVLVS